MKTTNPAAPATATLTVSALIDITNMSDADLDALLTAAADERATRTRIDAQAVAADVTAHVAEAAAQMAPMTPIAVPFADALASFVDAVNAMRVEYYASHYSNLTAETVTVAPRGTKYAKLVTNGSVYCFVRKSDGAILKAASWKAPAKHARGNINDANPLDAVTCYGAKYLV